MNLIDYWSDPWEKIADNLITSEMKKAIGEIERWTTEVFPLHYLLGWHEYLDTTTLYNSAHLYCSAVDQKAILAGEEAKNNNSAGTF